VRKLFVEKNIRVYDNEWRGNARPKAHVSGFWKGYNLGM